MNHYLAKVMLSLTVRKSKKIKDCHEISFVEDCTMKYLHDAIGSLLEVLGNHAGFVLKIKKDQEIDLAGVQTILFMKRFCQMQNKTFITDVAPENKSKNILIKSGFNSLIETL